MTVDATFSGRVNDPGTGHELIVENGQVVARVLPGNNWVVDEQTGTGLELRPDQTYDVTASGHAVILNPGQEWVATPGGSTVDNPAGGFVRETGA